MLPGEIHDLGHLGLGNLVCEDAANADTAAMDVHHDTGGFLTTLGEKPFEDVYDELHRRVVVVQHQYLVHRRLFRLRLGLDDNAGSGSFLAALSVVAHVDPSHGPS